MYLNIVPVTIEAPMACQPTGPLGPKVARLTAPQGMLAPELRAARSPRESKRLAQYFRQEPPKGHYLRVLGGRRRMLETPVYRATKDGSVNLF